MVKIRMHLALFERPISIRCLLSKNETEKRLICWAWGCWPLVWAQAPEIQQMYSLDIPVSALRTKVRQQFEKHRYVNQLPVVDMLLFQSHSEYQVRRNSPSHIQWEVMGAEERPSEEKAMILCAQRAGGND